VPGAGTLAANYKGGAGMAHTLSREFLEKRTCLFEFWHLGARIVDKEAKKGELTTAANVLFSMFVKAEHPHLLYDTEAQMLDLMDLNKAMPPKLLAELRPKVRATAGATKIPPDLLLAAAYGYALCKMNDNAGLTADIVIREVVHKVSSEIEQEMVGPVGTEVD
jgi:hypothetical protein